MNAGFGLRQNLPFLNGVFVAVSAIADARLVIDGPFCVIQKAELHGAHDLGATLVSPTGQGRLVHSDLQIKGSAVFNALLDRGDLLVRLLAEVATLPDTGAVFLTSMDFHQVLATPLERYRRAATKQGGAPLVLVDSRSLDGDWLDGYARVVDRLAEVLELPPAAPEPRRVALVGHFMDRREGDQLGNLHELTRLLAGAGADVASLWLDGGPLEALRGVHRAGVIVSLPYARAAARRLAERLNVPCVEADLPIGLAATCRFVRQVAAAIDNRAAAEVFLRSEVDALLPTLRPLAHRFLAGRRVLLNADPYLAASLAELLGELGMEVVGVTVPAIPELLAAADRERLLPLHAVFQPELGARGAAGLCDDDEVDADVLIASSLFPHDPRRATWIPFGYPNFLRHPTALRPFLGFAGARTWVDDLVEACVRAELRRSAAPEGEP